MRVAHLRAAGVRGRSWSIFPFVVAVSTSLKRNTDIFTYPPSLVPKKDATIAGRARSGCEGDPLPAVHASDGRERRLRARRRRRVAGRVPAARRPRARDHARPPTPARRPVRPSPSTARRRTCSSSRSTARRSRPTAPASPSGGLFQSRRRPRPTRVLSLVNTADAERAVRSAASRTSARWSTDKNLGRSLTNTVLVTIAVVIGQILTSILGGYAFARIDFKGRDGLFMLYLGSVMIPFVVLIIPLFQLMLQLRLARQPGGADHPVHLHRLRHVPDAPVLRRHPARRSRKRRCSTVPARSRILWKVMVPLARPAIATLATFGFLYAWNSFFWPLVIINSGNPDRRRAVAHAVDAGRTIEHRHQPRVRRRRAGDDAADPGVPVRTALLRRELRLERPEVRERHDGCSHLQRRHQAVQGRPEGRRRPRPRHRRRRVHGARRAVGVRQVAPPCG